MMINFNKILDWLQTKYYSILDYFANEYCPYCDEITIDGECDYCQSVANDNKN